MAERLSWAAIAAMVFWACVPLQALEPPSAGRIKVASGSAFIVRQQTAIPARVGQEVFETDGLRTGADGRIGITLRDGTRISLGPESQGRIDRFVYAPSEGRLRFAFNLARGVLAYVSGQIARLSPDSVRLETPAGIVGVRGTSLAIRYEP
jgi:hypothetical protein